MKIIYISGFVVLFVVAPILVGILTKSVWAGLGTYALFSCVCMIVSCKDSKKYIVP